MLGAWGVVCGAWVLGSCGVVWGVWCVAGVVCWLCTMIYTVAAGPVAGRVHMGRNGIGMYWS